MSPRCPYCLDDLLPDQDTVRCTTCRTPHHKGCFQENEGCVSYGCMGMEEETAGLSIFAKAAIKISHRASHHVELGPFGFGFKLLAPVPELRPSWRCPQPYTRLGLESREVREGELVRGRGVVYVPAAMPFKRIELSIYQGIGKPQLLETVYLTDSEGKLFGASPRLQSGSHPFYLQFRAPETTPPVDPYLLELILVRSMFKEVRSSRLPLFLLQRQVVSRPSEPPPPIPIRIQRPAPDPALLLGQREFGPADPVAPWSAPPGPLAGSGPLAPHLPDPPPGPSGRDPFLRPGQEDPERTLKRPPQDLAGYLDGGQEAPRPPTVRLNEAPLEIDASWHTVPLTQAGNGGVLRGQLPVRPFRLSTPPPPHISLSAPSMPFQPEFLLLIQGGPPLRSLNLAVQAELVRPGGGEVAWDGFPVTLEARVVGGAGLEPHRYGNGNGLQARVAVPPEHLTALKEARATGAHNAALRLRLGVDGLSHDGQVVSGPSKTVTYTVS